MMYTDMKSEGSSHWVLRNMSSVRSGYVGLISVLALVLLVLLYVDQGHLHQCNHTTPKDDPHIEPHIDVVVNIPPQNITTGTGDEHDNFKETKNKWNYNWDKKAWPNPREAQGVPIRTLLLVRHGQYDLNTGHLNENGRQQANLTGLRLKQLNMKYNQIIHSTLDRAIETADIIHKHLPDLPKSSDVLLSEGGPVPPVPTITYWSLPERNYFVDGPRLEAGFRKHFYRAAKTDTRETIDVLVGHGNIFRYFILRALQFPSEAWMRVFLPHASISLVHINPDGTVTLTKFGDSGHLPPHLVTI